MVYLAVLGDAAAWPGPDLVRRVLYLPHGYGYRLSFMDAV